MISYGGFRLEKEVGNNVFAYQQRKPDAKLWIPSFREESPDKVALGNKPAFAELNSSGKAQTFMGLQFFLFFTFNSVPIYIVDNHNHALVCWYYERLQQHFSKGILLVHLDQHSDMGENPFSLETESWEEICDFANIRSHVGNFIVPALKTGLLSGVQHLRTESSLLEASIPKVPYLCDIDLDFRAEEMGILNHQSTLTQTKKLIQSAKAVTIATSPYFLNQFRAIKLIHQLFL